MTDEEKARLHDLLEKIVSESKGGVDAELFKAHIAIMGNSVTCGFGTDLNMNKAEDWMKDWFDETIDRTKDILAEQTSKLTHYLVDHYGGEYNSAELDVVNSKSFARRQREHEQ